MSSRDAILQKLRGAKRPFAAATLPAEYRPMVPLRDASREALRERFVTEAKKAACVVHQVNANETAIARIFDVIGEDSAISSWDLAQISLPGLAEALDAANIARAAQDANARVGLTGVDAALAATGSIVVMSGVGRGRAASLLPPVHIAVVRDRQILPDLESWWAVQAETGLAQTRQHSNIVVITGPSRTADIAMQLVMGMHGPRELNLILLTN